MRYEDYDQVLNDFKTGELCNVELLLKMQETMYRMHVISVLKEYQKSVSRINDDKALQSFKNLLLNVLGVLVNERRITNCTDYASLAKENTAKNQLYDVMNWIFSDAPHITCKEQKEQLCSYIKVFFVTWENYRETLIKITEGEKRNAN